MFFVFHDLCSFRSFTSILYSDGWIGIIVKDEIEKVSLYICTLHGHTHFCFNFAFYFNMHESFQARISKLTYRYIFRFLMQDLLLKVMERRRLTHGEITQRTLEIFNILVGILFFTKKKKKQKNLSQRLTLKRTSKRQLFY